MSKTLEDKLAELLKEAESVKERMVQKEAKKQLKAMQQATREKEAERKADTRRKVIMGGLMIAEALRTPEGAAKALRLIDAKVTRDPDKKALAPLVAELQAAAARSQSVGG